ncbi:MAG TPA: hypothetical protein VGC55_11640 [Dokdonella sp.]
MLRELNNIASDMLGLHGYPMQPVAWGEIFGKRARADAAKTVARPSVHVPATPADTSRDAAPAPLGARSHA